MLIWRSVCAPVRSRQERPLRGERTAKYNQVLRIEEELGKQTLHDGTGFRVTPWMG